MLLLLLHARDAHTMTIRCMWGVIQARAENWVSEATVTVSHDVAEVVLLSLGLVHDHAIGAVGVSVHPPDSADQRTPGGTNGRPSPDGV